MKKEKAEIESVSLRPTEKAELQRLGKGSLTQGIRQAKVIADRVTELGNGDLEKGLERLTLVLYRFNDKMMFSITDSIATEEKNNERNSRKKV